LREEHRLRVFKNTVLRKIFGPKKDEVTGSGEDCIMKFYDLYSSSNIIREMISRKMRQAGHVARVGARRDVQRGVVGRRREEEHLEDLSVKGKIILK